MSLKISLVTAGSLNTRKGAVVTHTRGVIMNMRRTAKIFFSRNELQKWEQVGLRRSAVASQVENLLRQLVNSQSEPEYLHLRDQFVVVGVVDVAGFAVGCVNLFRCHSDPLLNQNYCQ